MLKIKLNQSTWKIIYKLLCDALFLFLIFFLLVAGVETVLSGLITSHFGFLKIVILLILNLLAIYIVGFFVKTEKLITPKKNKKTIIILTIFTTLLIFGNLLALNLWLASFITLVSLAIIYFIYKNIF